ncbi:hypothetical protein H4R26_000245 [Coemansia thaxteri]|uniref:Uncharacterized protein n=1 Tax=Coemansia thaxteri TaxID=2663907 RepID=A0A9W8EI36_9FUNG|nr:hypothetical protein H4R26_000245 [Coemansia thaxteri]KAJ2487597.1 hypothetical protein EV174_000424 [Coemansia sp. RSA 2320]
MFISPLFKSDAAEDYINDKKNPYSILFLPSSSASGYLRFKELTDPLVLILLENGFTHYNAVSIEAVHEFKEKKEIFIEEGVAFFIGEDVSIVNKDFDDEKFEESFKKFKIPKKGSGGRETDYSCEGCCVIL